MTDTFPRPHVRWFDAGLPWPCWEWCRCGVGVAHEGAQEARGCDLRDFQGEDGER